MFETPYQTTPCSRFDLRKTIEGVRRLEIEEELMPAPGSVTGLKLIRPGSTQIQPFFQPLTKLDAPNLQASAVIDARSILKADGTPIKTDVYKYQVLMGDLSTLWYTQGYSFRRDALNLGDFPAKVFNNWFSSAIAMRQGLDLGQSVRLKACVAVYYAQLFTPLSDSSDEEARDRMLVRASRALPGIDPVTLSETLGDIPALNNLKDFIDWVVKVVDTPRVEKLTVATVYRYLDYSFSPQYREAVCVALEYPPIFLAMMYAACTERFYSKTGLGVAIDRVIKRGEDADFIKNVDHLLGKR